MDGPLLEMTPLVVYFLFAAVHDPDRGGLDRLRTWLAAVGLVTLAALGWLLA